MDAKELRGLDVEALRKELDELNQALFKLRVQKATQQLQNTSQIRATKRAIARVKTVIAQKATK